MTSDQLSITTDGRRSNLPEALDLYVVTLKDGSEKEYTFRRVLEPPQPRRRLMSFELVFIYWHLFRSASKICNEEAVRTTKN